MSNRVCSRAVRPISIGSMNTIHPWQLLLITVVGWINRHQQGIIGYLVEENRVLKRQLGGRRVRLTDDERRRLAVKGKALGRRLLGEVATIVTPDTILAWYRHFDRSEMGLLRPKKARTTKNEGRAFGPRGPHGARESDVGIHEDPRSACPRRSRALARNDRQHPEGEWDRAHVRANETNARFCELTGTCSPRPTSSPSRSLDPRV